MNNVQYVCNSNADYYDVSVIVPLYNTEKYIAECIKSLEEQTKKDIEIVIVDDGSIDNSLMIAKKAACKYDNITLITQKNMGVCFARSLGIQVAKGKYIGWLDSDDLLKPEAIEKLYNLMKSKEADYGYYNIEFFPQEITAKQPWFKKYYGVKDWNFIERNSQCTNSLTKKELLVKLNIPELFKEYYEYAWIAVLLFAQEIVVLDEKLYLYRVGHASASGGSYKGKVAKFKGAVETTAKLDNIIKGTEFEQSLKTYFEYRYIYTLLLLLIVACVNKDKETCYSAKKKLIKVRYNENELTKKILDNNFGVIKSFVMRKILPKSYYLSNAIVNMFLS